jgi:hypothetical protein
MNRAHCLCGAVHIDICLPTAVDRALPLPTLPTGPWLRLCDLGRRATVRQAASIHDGEVAVALVSQPYRHRRS